MTDETYTCARCGSPVHDYSEVDQRAACETCEDWCPVKVTGDTK